MTQVEESVLDELNGITPETSRRKLLIIYKAIRNKEGEHNVPEDTYGSLLYLDLIAALQVITRDPKIKAFLEQNDPAALCQANAALQGGFWPRNQSSA
jgi:hypothetical protein